MSFPVIANTNSSTEASDTASHTVDLPANIQAGDLLLVFFSIDGNSNLTWPAGWTEFFEKGRTITCRTECAWRKATGNEGATITVTSINAQKSAHVSWRITGAEDPTVQPPEASTGTDASSVNPDSDNLTPTGGTKDYLAVSVEGNDNDTLATVYPSGFTSWGTLASGSGIGHCNIAIAYKQWAASALNPGAFTIAEAENWNAGTIAVHPSTDIDNVIFFGCNF